MTSWRGCPYALPPGTQPSACLSLATQLENRAGGHVLVPLGARKLVSFPKWEILELVRVVWLAFGILAEKAICHSWFLNLVGTWKGKVGLAVDDQCS